MNTRTLRVAAVLAGSVLLTATTQAAASAATPVITDQKNSVAVVYPAVDEYLDTITFSWKVDPGLEPGGTLSLDVMDASHTSVFQTVFDDVTQTSYIWNGRTTGGSIVPDGTYYTRVTADNGVDPADSNNGPSFVVSDAELVEKTWSKQVTASGSMMAKLPGKCSEIRKPGRKLGAGSLGYYSNTKCTKPQQDFAVSIHSVAVPPSFRPGQVKLSAYGVAVKPGSVMRVGFLGVRRPTKIGPVKGWHDTPSVSAAGSLAGSKVQWGAVVQGGNRYDIKYFKVTYTYTTLG